MSDAARQPALLSLQRVSLRFGGLAALQDVDLEVGEAEIVAVIGPNGAGKTSLFNAISGIYVPTAGRIAFSGVDLRAPPSAAAWRAFAAVGLATALAALLIAVDVDALWAAVFLYAPPWEWRLAEAAAALAAHVAATPPPRLVAAAVVGGAAGALGALAIWQRGRWTPQAVARHGVARTFQNIRLFAGLSARDNVLVAMDARLRRSAGGGPLTRLRRLGVDALLPAVALAALALLGFASGDGVAAGGGEALASSAFVVCIFAALGWAQRVRRRGALTAAGLADERTARAQADALLALVGLGARADDPASALPYGDQRRLEIARALATAPRLLLLDEPAAGMNPTEVDGLRPIIEAIRARGVTVLLIEHHMRLVMEVADRVAVLVHGRCVAVDTPARVRQDPAVIAAYLGGDEDAP